MNYLVKRFNDEGIIKFDELLQEFRMQKSIDDDKLSNLLNNIMFTEEVEGNIFIEMPMTKNKFEIAKYLSEILGLKSNRQFYRDNGLWTWLSAFMLDIIVPYMKNGKERDFKESALYVLKSTVYNRYYRHLLAFASLSFTELGEKGKVFLRGNIFERGDLVEQLAAVYNIQRNPSIIEAATILFYNNESDSIYKGAVDKYKGGTARRFRMVLKQFQLTFDLNSMNGTQIVKILPGEFSRWKKAS
jgi:hypothetical protein